MRTTTLSALLVLAAAPLAAQDAARFQPSGRGTSEIVVMTEGDEAASPKIRIDYGQPHLRGRALLTDSLVPAGKMWRAGANDATRLKTDLMLMMGDAHLMKGSYIVTVLPTAEGWFLVLQKDVGQGGGAYDQANEVARVKLQHRTMATPVEGLTMWLVPASSGLRGELRIVWGTHELTAPWTAM